MKPKPILNKIDNFINSAKDNIQVKKNEGLIKRTHYFTQSNLDWIDAMAYHDKIDKSEVVRKALEMFIPDKYK